MSWKEVSPVFSLTHWMPRGEKIEKPEEEPVKAGKRSGSSVLPCMFFQEIQCLLIGCLPMYRVSPQLLVTREHIISDKASTSC
jgi:hypothetical protein